MKPVTVPLVHHMPHVVCPAMHTEQTPLANTSYFATVKTLVEVTHTVSIKKYFYGFNSLFT